MTGLTASLVWPAARLAEGLGHLCRAPAAGAAGRSGGTGLESAVRRAGAAAGLEPEAVSSRHGNLIRCLAASAPIVVKLPESEAALLVERVGARHAVLVDHQGRRRRVPCKRLGARLTPRLPPELSEAIGRLAAAGAGERPAAALGAAHLAERDLFVGWRLAPAPEPGAQAPGLRSPALMGRAAALVGVHLLHFVFWIGSWLALVTALLGVGDPEPWLVLWLAALATAMAALPVESVLQHELAVRVGLAVKRYLLDATLAMDRSRIRSRGIGRLIALALEANTLDALASKGGIRVLLTALDLLVVGAAFAWFAGPHPLLWLLLTLLVAGGFWCRRYHREQVRQHAANLEVVGVHTEELVGHRTRKAFLARAAWHAEEDARLADYERASEAAARIALRITLVPRLWAALGTTVVLLELFRGDAATSFEVALVGFVIVGFATLQSAATGAMQLIRAAVAYRHATRVQAAAAAPATAGAVPAPVGRMPLSARGLQFTYPDAAKPVLADVELTLAPGARVVLTGASGGGKSTLGALLAGRLLPDAGTVLSSGIDSHVAGRSGWREQVCYVPQWTSNHVLTESFAFNLLLGRRWPPTPDDLAEAHTVAEMLGLGDLIERMPAGIMQMVGEGGWHLSQGERSRLFAARGILQGANLLVADELLSPLDPATALQVVAALESLAGEVILIAHD